MVARRFSVTEHVSIRPKPTCSGGLYTTAPGSRRFSSQAAAGVRETLVDLPNQTAKRFRNGCRLTTDSDEDSLAFRQAWRVWRPPSLSTATRMVPASEADTAYTM